MLGAITGSTELAKNKWTPIVLGVVILGVAAVAYFGVVRPILCKTGIATCSGDRRRKKIEEKLKNSDSFNPNFYQASKITMSHTQAKTIADKIEKALSGADDEEAVYGLLRDAKNANNLSLISFYYNQRHQQSLVDNLIYDMSSEEELQRILNIIQDFK